MRMFLLALVSIFSSVSCAQTEPDAPLQLAEKMPVWSSCVAHEDETEASSCTQRAIAEFVMERVSYSRKMRKHNLSGTVIVRFVVEKDGSIGNIEVVRGVDHALDDQVVEAVSKFPNFKPGEQFGRPVRVQYALPVKFSL